jgi:signal transduction histidine kinase
VLPVLSGVALATAAILAVLALRAVRGARRREEAANLSAERSRTIKNEFVSMVSHELRTPLTSIAGFSSMLLDSWRALPPEEVEEFLGIINVQSEHLSGLVEDLLVIPRIEAGRLQLEPETFDLSNLAHRVNDFTFPPGSGKEASVAIPGGVQVNADARRVHQVLRNLLDNARKYGGDQILVEGAFVGDQYLVVVSDNGSGVPDDQVSRIFEHFEQLATGDTKIGQGAGLGLPIARQLARAMGGDVWHERRFPTGSRFCFTIPMAPPEPEAVADEALPVEERTRLPGT